MADEEERADEVDDATDDATQPAEAPSDDAPNGDGTDDESSSARDKLRELGSYIRDQRSRAEYSLRHLARLAGVSNPYLSQIERGLRKPSAEILQGIAKALQISSETLYVKAGILEERPDSPDLESAIERDETLNDRQRAALVEIYRSFRRENEDDATSEAAAAVAAAATGQAVEPSGEAETNGEIADGDGDAVDAGDVDEPARQESQAEAD